MIRSSTKINWETFWQAKKDVQEVYSNSERIRTHLCQLTNLSEKRILEIGAGTGRDSFYMTNDGGLLYLLDYAKNSLKIIQQLIPEDKPIFAIGGDAFGLPFQDGTFDIIFHQGLLEHFRKAEALQLLSENVRVLKPGGLLLVDVPQRYHVYTIIKHVLILFNVWFAGWEREFSLRELIRILSELRLNVVHSYGEWMYPSLFYRILREASSKIGIKLPLKPIQIPVLSSIRKAIRRALEGSSLQKNTALSIGVIARK